MSADIVMGQSDLINVTQVQITVIFCDGLIKRCVCVCVCVCVTVC